MSDKDLKQDVVDCAVALHQAEEHMKPLLASLAAARERVKWARVQLSAATLALRSQNLVSTKPPAPGKKIPALRA